MSMAPPVDVAAWQREPTEDERELGGAAWTPPVDQGLVPLRPMGFSEILGAAFRLFRTSPGTSIGSALLVLAVTSLVAMLLPIASLALASARSAAAAPEDAEAIRAGGFLLTVVSSLAAVVVASLGDAVMQGVLAHVVARGALGERVGVAETWRVALRRALPLVAYSLLASTALALGVGVVVLVAVLPGALLGGGFGIAGILLGLLLGLALAAAVAFLGVKLCVAPTAIVLEGLGPAAAMARSWRLTRGSFWRALGAILAVRTASSTASGTVSGGLQMVVLFALAIVAPLGVAASGQEGLMTGIALSLLGSVFVASLLVQAILLVITGGTLPIIYLDLRMRAEGLNLRLSRFLEQRASGAEPEWDPFARDERAERGAQADAVAAPAWAPAPLAGGAR
ncbi:hypothetical protein USB125703_01074 [Pseudoclavibacter triregionum]|nr:hypothetical protein USB125703_01074 [Pseudoclavibacter triregionum]